MNKVCKIIVCGLMFCVIQIGCSNSKMINTTKSTSSSATATMPTNVNNHVKTYDYFAIPDKIIFYDHGKTKEFEKGNGSFIKILDLTNKRFGSNINFYESATEIEGLNKLEQNELMLEFIYSDMKETKYKSVNTIKKYKRLLMPLSGHRITYLYFDDGEKYSSGPIGTLSSPDELVKILK